MYLPPAFAEDDPAVLHDLMEAAGVASLVTLTDGQLFATTVPLLVDRTFGPHGRLIGHLARANPQWHTAPDGPEALVIFQGLSAYVSPSLYPSKVDHGRVVPTWNYETIHARGPLVVHDDPAWTLDLVTRLTDHHEATSSDGPPWAVSDAPPDFIAGQLKAIVGIEIPLTALVGKRKLSQNRPEADRLGVVAGFRRRAERGVAGAAAMADAVAGRRRSS